MRDACRARLTVGAETKGGVSGNALGGNEGVRSDGEAIYEPARSRVTERSEGKCYFNWLSNRRFVGRNLDSIFEQAQKIAS